MFWLCKQRDQILQLKGDSKNPILPKQIFGQNFDDQDTNIPKKSAEIKASTAPAADQNKV